MKATENKYPVYEANQVLSNTHLNQTSSYQDEQSRLTRANLIGVGIVCGLQLSYDSLATISISKGCGISSEGYLLIEPEDVSLTTYRSYTLSNYPALDGITGLWELLPDLDPNPKTALTKEFLDKKAVLLFLELKKDNLRNCSPNNCDDKGSEINLTLRRLLITLDDLKIVLERAAALGTKALADPESELAQRLDLPDLHLPRYDVLNSFKNISSDDILKAFQGIIKPTKLVSQVADVLTLAYTCYGPVLTDVDTAQFRQITDLFMKKFGFLETADYEKDLAVDQKQFLPYYYDFFDDIIRAYDEFRYWGLKLICACCPDERLFPRHLLLGQVNNPEVNRQIFLASAAISNCEETAVAVKQLFQRLLQMIDQFREKPVKVRIVKRESLAIDPDIRITPSKLGDVPLSNRAIPYYYLQDGHPPLYQLWSPDKTAKGRSNQNLSYRANEYNSRENPDNVAFLNPLLYDLEPYNFFRIEGHIRKPLRVVYRTLYTFKNQYRLPIEILPIDLNSEKNWLLDLLKGGIQHKAGVTVGGMFLLVYESPARQQKGAFLADSDNEVVADFYLPNIDSILMYAFYARLVDANQKMNAILLNNKNRANNANLVNPAIQNNNLEILNKFNLNKIIDPVENTNLLNLFDLGNKSDQDKNIDLANNPDLLKNMMLAHTVNLVKNLNLAKITNLQDANTSTTENLQPTVNDTIGTVPIHTAAEELNFTEVDTPISKRSCAYRLWVQPPSAKGLKYKDCTITSNFLLQFNDNSFELPEATDFLNQLANASALNNDYQTAMQKVFTQLQNLINQTLVSKLGDAGKDSLVFSYASRADDDPFAIFRIDYRAEDRFSFEFNFRLSVKPLLQLSVHYANAEIIDGKVFNGMILNKGQGIRELRVPAFSCLENDNRICQGDKPQLSMAPPKRNDRGYEFEGMVNKINAANISAWIWDAPDMIPSLTPFFTGQKTLAEFDQPSDGKSSLRLTAITDKGCFGLTEKEF